MKLIGSFLKFASVATLVTCFTVATFGYFRSDTLTVSNSITSSGVPDTKTVNKPKTTATPDQTDKSADKGKSPDNDTTINKDPSGEGSKGDGEGTKSALGPDKDSGPEKDKP